MYFHRPGQHIRHILPARRLERDSKFSSLNAISEEVHFPSFPSFLCKKKHLVKNRTLRGFPPPIPCVTFHKLSILFLFTDCLPSPLGQWRGELVADEVRRRRQGTPVSPRGSARTSHKPRTAEQVLDERRSSPPLWGDRVDPARGARPVSCGPLRRSRAFGDPHRPAPPAPPRHPPSCTGAEPSIVAQHSKPLESGDDIHIIIHY